MWHSQYSDILVAGHLAHQSEFQKIKQLLFNFLSCKTLNIIMSISNSRLLLLKWWQIGNHVCVKHKSPLFDHMTLLCRSNKFSCMFPRSNNLLHKTNISTHNVKKSFLEKEIHHILIHYWYHLLESGQWNNKHPVHHQSPTLYYPFTDLLDPQGAI